jgi:hypothetical protein
MRTVVYRVLAGFLAVVFLAFLVFGDTSKMSLQMMIGTCVIGTGFGLYASLGTDLGERLIWKFFGGSNPDRDRRPPV